MVTSKKKTSRSRVRPRTLGAESHGPRSCLSCDAKLAYDHSGRFCSPCEESERGLRDAQQVVDFALDLHPLPQTLGVLGLDYIFFHQFLNQALQDELAQLRRTLSHRPEPPGHSRSAMRPHGQPGWRRATRDAIGCPPGQRSAN